MLGGDRAVVPLAADLLLTLTRIRWLLNELAVLPPAIPAPFSAKARVVVSR